MTIEEQRLAVANQLVDALLHGHPEWCPACYVHLTQSEPGVHRLGEHMETCPLAKWLELEVERGI
jgi:hypothetical protein